MHFHALDEGSVSLLGASHHPEAALTPSFSRSQYKCNIGAVVPVLYLTLLRGHPIFDGEHDADAIGKGLGPHCTGVVTGAGHQKQGAWTTLSFWGVGLPSTLLLAFTAGLRWYHDPTLRAVPRAGSHNNGMGRNMYPLDALCGYTAQWHGH